MSWGEETYLISLYAWRRQIKPNVKGNEGWNAGFCDLLRHQLAQAFNGRIAFSRSQLLHIEKEKIQKG